jgi:hypothetical protein
VSSSGWLPGAVRFEDISETPQVNRGISRTYETFGKTLFLCEKWANISVAAAWSKAYNCVNALFTFSFICLFPSFFAGVL